MLDNIPFSSTLNNICDVAQKAFYSATMDREEIKNDYYCNYICNNKSLTRSCILMVPVLGQLVVFSHDWLKGVGNGSSLKNATPEQQKDEAYVLSFLRHATHETKTAEYEENPFLSDSEFMLKAIQTFGPLTFRFAGDNLKKDLKFILEAIKIDNEVDTVRLSDRIRHQDPNVSTTICKHFRR